MTYYGTNSNISDLLGKTLTEVERVGDEEIYFTTAEGEKYVMYHEQDCCENVVIESIVGELADLVGSPITMAEEVSNYDGGSRDEIQDYWSSDSYTWTFYKLATVKGYVDIRWYGTSNGYYSESVDFVKLEATATD